jgi:FemAB-related protein (PEP-CTERM system-associated)
MQSGDALEIREIKDTDAWDRYVLQSGASKYTHLFNWSRVIKDAYGHKPVYLAAVRPAQDRNRGRNPEISGILPLFRFKTLTNSSRLVSVPFFDTAGILAREGSTRDFLFKSGLGILIKKPGISGVVLRQADMLDIPDLTLLNCAPHIFSGKVGLSLSILGSEWEMMQAFKSKLRSQIKKSETCGLTWKIGKAGLIDPFYAVFSRNMRDLGSPVHSKKFFKTIFNYFNPHAFICVVFHKSRPVAAAFMFRFKKTLVNPWASSIREFRFLNANLYLYWQMIRFSCHLKVEIFDMGRSSKNVPTFRFKKQFCPDEHPIYWYAWSFPEKARFQPEETLTLPGWKKLPLGMANLMGPHIRKRISL